MVKMKKIIRFWNCPSSSFSKYLSSLSEIWMASPKTWVISEKCPNNFLWPRSFFLSPRSRTTCHKPFTSFASNCCCRFNPRHISRCWQLFSCLSSTCYSIATVIDLTSAGIIMTKFVRKKKSGHFSWLWSVWGQPSPIVSWPVQVVNLFILIFFDVHDLVISLHV